MRSRRFTTGASLVVATVVAAGTTLVAIRAEAQVNTLSATALGTPQTRVVSDTTAFTLDYPTGADSGWQDISGASVNENIALSWKSGLLLIHFSAIGTCPGGFCWVRVLVDGQEANPTGDPSFVAPVNPGPNNTAPTWPLDIDRWVTATPGNHTVQVQAEVSGSPFAFTLQNWVLTVERSKTS